MMLSSTSAEDGNFGSDACAPIFSGVGPLLYQLFGTDPELRKWVHRRLTHFCHGLLKQLFAYSTDLTEVHGHGFSEWSLKPNRKFPDIPDIKRTQSGIKQHRCEHSQAGRNRQTRSG